MNFFLEIGLGNLGVAFVLALFAWMVSVWIRRPSLTHGLFLLVLIKLLTPPLVTVPLPHWHDGMEIPTVANEPVAMLPTIHAAQEIEDPFVSRDGNFAEPIVAGSPLPEGPPAPMNPEAQTTVIGFDWSFYVGVVWLSGSVAWFSLALGRMFAFQRALAHATPVDETVLATVNRLARTMGINPPQAAWLPGQISPMLWAFGWRARLLIPKELWHRLSVTQQESLLVHELAHFRRGDHWVRLLEFVCIGLYWWCPLVWWVKSATQDAEEECCDAWVLAVLPKANQAYALALLETVDFLSEKPTPLPMLASGIGKVKFLQRRLTMILRGKTSRTLPLLGTLALLIVGAAALPVLPTFAQDDVPRKKEGDRRKEGDGPRRKEGFEGKKDQPREGDRKKEFEGKKKFDDGREPRPEGNRPFDPLAGADVPPEVRAKFREMQEKIEQRQRLFQDQIREARERFQEDQSRMMKEMVEMARKAGVELPFRPGGQGEPGRPGQEGGPGGFGPRGPGGPGGFGGFGPGGFGGDQAGRIERLERMLERLTDELVQMRRQFGQKEGGPRREGAPREGDQPRDPNRRKDGDQPRDPNRPRDGERPRGPGGEGGAFGIPGAPGRPSGELPKR